jgi:carbamoyl-phosphate synthase large subunit
MAEREGWFRPHIIGTDCDPEAIGRLMVDEFHRLPRGDSPEYEHALNDLRAGCGGWDVSLVQTTAECMRLKSAGPQTSVAADKAALMRIADAHGVPVPWSPETGTIADALDQVCDGDNWAVVKPVGGNGGRGVYVVNPFAATKMWSDKPEHRTISRDALLSMADQSLDHAVTVQEYLPGPEYTVDVLAQCGDALAIVPRRRIAVRSGITFDCVAESHPDIERYTRKLVDTLDLTGPCGFQFRCDANGKPKLLECNPRIQGTMVASAFANVNIIAAHVQVTMGKERTAPRVQWGTRFQRYWGGIATVTQEVGRV